MDIFWGESEECPLPNINEEIHGQYIKFDQSSPIAELLWVPGLASYVKKKLEPPMQLTKGFHRFNVTAHAGCSVVLRHIGSLELEEGWRKYYSRNS